MSINTDRLLEVMAQLRNPDGGCPWDVEQTFATVAPYTIEEAYEVADAIEKRDMELLKDELGDLLFQVVFHARMAEEAELFNYEDVAATVSEKMVRRHPHVFGGATVDTAEAQLKAWEETKAEERRSRGAKDDDSALSDVALGLPALVRAEKLQRRAARVGFDWDEAKRAFEKVHEEIAEVEVEMANGADRRRLEDEIGDLLFACVNFARKLEIDAEAALRGGNAKFERRFRAVEGLLKQRGTAPADSSLDEMEACWTTVKAAE